MEEKRKENGGMRKALLLASTAIIVLSIVMFVPFVRAIPDENSKESADGVSVSVMPVIEKVGCSKTTVAPSVSKLEPLKVTAAPKGAGIPTLPWTYILIGAGLVALTMFGFGLKKRQRKISCLRYISATLVLSLLATTPAYVHAEATLDMNVTKWDLSGIWDMTLTIVRDSVDSHGNVWFVGYWWSGPYWAPTYYSKIGRLNPSTNEVTIWDYPVYGMIVSVTVDQSNKVWFVDAYIYNNYVGQLDPATNLFTIWSVPGISGAYVTVGSDSHGNVYIPEYSANKIARINSITNELTEWAIPTDDSQPCCIDVDAEGNVWFTEGAGKKIGRLNPSTDEITEWTVPSAYSCPAGIDASGGLIYFTLPGAYPQKIGKLNPLTNEITQYVLPPQIGYLAGPAHGLFADAEGNVWFTTVSFLVKLGADNIITYWYHEGITYGCGVTVDTKVNVGDVYTPSYSYYYDETSQYRFSIQAISRFRLAT